MTFANSGRADGSYAVQVSIKPRSSAVTSRGQRRGGGELNGPCSSRYSGHPGGYASAPDSASSSNNPNPRRRWRRSPPPARSVPVPDIPAIVVERITQRAPRQKFQHQRRLRVVHLVGPHQVRMGQARQKPALIGQRLCHLGARTGPGEFTATGTARASLQAWWTS